MLGVEGRVTVHGRNLNEGLSRSLLVFHRRCGVKNGPALTSSAYQFEFPCPFVQMCCSCVETKPFFPPIVVNGGKAGVRKDGAGKVRLVCQLLSMYSSCRAMGLCD